MSAEGIVREIAAVAAADMPLAAGLRAAAGEADHGRTARALGRVAEQVEAGRGLDQVLADPALRLPAHVRGLLQAAARTADFGETLGELTDAQQRLWEMRRSVGAALAYPLVLAGLSVAVVLLLSIVVAGPFGAMLNDFGVKPSPAAQWVLWFCRQGVWALLTGAVLAAVVAGIFRVLVGRTRWTRMLTTVPLFGVLWQWSGAAELTRLLGTLVQQGLPLPESLRLTAAGLRDASMAAACTELATGVAQGRPLAEALEAGDRLPATLTPLVRWGDSTGQLPAALTTASELFAERVEMRAGLLRAVLPPLIVVLAGLMVLTMVVSLGESMRTMIEFLSMFGSGPALPEDDLNLLNFSVVSLIGAALLWAARIMFGAGRGRHDDLARRCLLVAGWTLLLGGLIGLAVATTGFLSILFLAGLAVLGESYAAYMAWERRALLSFLAVAAEKGIPLEQAARAFADERSLPVGARVARLATLLEGGTPLAQALALSGNPLPADAMLAARVGAATGRLGAALRMTVEHRGQFASTQWTALGQLFYVGQFVPVAFAILAFVMLKIVPVFTKMFDDFGLQLPWLTQSLVLASKACVVYWPVLLPFGMFLLLGVLALTSYSFFWTRYDIPLISHLWRRLDGALILRALSATVGRQRDFAATLAMLAREYPRPGAARRLERAAGYIAAGGHWCDGLYAAGLLRAADCGVLRAAERVGNLEWALAEMADSGLRRAGLWLRAVLGVTLPLAVLTLGFFVLYIDVALFLPLISMIEGLSL